MALAGAGQSCAGGASPGTAVSRKMLQYPGLLLRPEGTAGLAADLFNANIGGMASPGA